METTQKKAASFKGIRSAGWVIVICFIIAVLIFTLCWEILQLYEQRPEQPSVAG